jgi:hypothetical protein
MKHLSLIFSSQNGLKTLIEVPKLWNYRRKYRPSDGWGFLKFVFSKDTGNKSKNKQMGLQ